jgi:hypothetical protein
MFLQKLVYFVVGSTNFVIIAILTLALKGAWHFRQVWLFALYFQLLHFPL